MNRKALFWFSLMLFSSSIPLFSFAGGSGTLEDPYRVSTPVHLSQVKNYRNSCFVQIRDIDLDVAPWNYGGGWTPVETYQDSHLTYDGNGHAITGLYVNRPNEKGVGLFKNFQGEIRNLRLVDINITGGEQTGGLIGFNQGTVKNCQCVTGTVSGSKFTGGLVGVNSGTISACHNVSEIQGGDFTGGLVGWNYNSAALDDCFNSGKVCGNNIVGGLVGINYDSSLHSCYNTGEVLGNEWLGGFVGYNSGEISRSYSTGTVSGQGKIAGFAGYNGYLASIQNCYATGDVSADDYAGGFVAWNSHFATIQNCFSIGAVPNISDAGGLLGYNYDDSGEIINSYWNVQTSGQTSSEGGEGRLTAQMVFPHDDDTYIGWDWDIWAPDVSHSINGGYPYLRGLTDEVAIVEHIAPPQESSIRSFPQPASQKPKISLKSDSAGELSWCIYNIRGQKVYSASICNPNREQSFELPGDAWMQLSNGVYLLSLESGNRKIASSRLVVLK